MLIKDYFVGLLGPDAPFALIAAVVFAVGAGIFLLRYFLIAGLGYGVSEALGRLAPSRRLQPQGFTREQVRREIVYSIMTSLIFAGVAGLIFLASKAGWTRIYTDVDAYGAVWFWASIPVMLLIHDFYFYWMHRAIHIEGIYEPVHKVHHLSTNPSPFAAFAFHPLEALAEAGIIPLIAITIPVHPMALMTFGMLSIIYNVYGHLGLEVMPRFLAKTPLIGLALNKSAYHNQHHRTFRSNYGLYTTIWDRLFGTLHARAEEVYDKATTRAQHTKGEASAQRHH